ncbi:MAG: flagellar basal body P-ring formation protein FlgA [Phycisphaerae bacterium]|nr:flagellar basal body P-ring formation protein FlgA [Phycisphaerae bacterium]
MKRTKTIQLNKALLIAIMVLFVSPLFAGRCQVRLHKSIEISAGTLVTLGDIADLRGADKKFNQQIEKLVVAEVAVDERQIFVGSFEISRALNDIGVNPASVDLFGAVHCLINVDAPVAVKNVVETIVTENSKKSEQVKTIEVKTVADELKNRIVLSTSLDADKVIVQFNSMNDDILTQRYDSKRFTIKPASTVTLGLVRFDITDNNAAKTTRISGTAKYICKSITAKYALKAGDIITEDNTRIATHSVTNLVDAGVENASILLGNELTRSIRAGQQINPSMLRRMTVVKRNDIVNVTIQVGSVALTKQGVAMDDGAPGDIITVKVEFQQQAKNKYSYAKKVSNSLAVTVVGPGEVSLNRQKASTEAVASITGKERK